jgi:hypothetical protein
VASGVVLLAVGIKRRRRRVRSLDDNGAYDEETNSRFEMMSV